MGWLIGWILYGIIVGILIRILSPGKEVSGLLETIGLGIVGSFIGGLINFFVSGRSLFETSGIFMGVLGGLIFCFFWKKTR